MGRWRRVVAAGVLGAVVAGLVSLPAWALSGVPPLAGPVVRRFDPPDQDWLAGHRGVDLLGPPGATVVAAAAGTITFAGQVGGKGVVVVGHGELRTTYEPVSALVKVGSDVSAGQAIGTLNDGHACPGGACLHWGLKRGDTYLDPLSLLGDRRIRLLPASAVEIARRAARARITALNAGEGTPGMFVVPVGGNISSPFGERMHPIDHVVKLHNGVDIGAACGTPIRAAAPGRVESVTYDDANGHKLVIDHGTLGGHRLRTIYLHATGYQVRPGQQVGRGDHVGQVGSTGRSTGCHLHLSVRIDGNYADPQKFF